MKRAMVIAVAALLAACDSDKPDVVVPDSDITVDQARKALPVPAQLDIDVPTRDEIEAKLAEIDAKIDAKIAEMEADIAAAKAAWEKGAEAAKEELEQQILDRIADAKYIPATLPAQTALVSSLVNLKIAGSVAKVQLLSTLNTESCTGSTCTFGPAVCTLGTNVYRLTVTKTSDSQFSWKVQGAKVAATTAAECLANVKNKTTVTVADSAWVTFISGESTVVAATDTTLPKAKGTITHDFTAAASLITPNPILDGIQIDPPSGKIVATFDNTGAESTVNVTATGLPDDTNGTYAFKAGAQGGTLELALTNATVAKKIDSKWDATGAGRSTVEGSVVIDGTAKQGSIKECWEGNAGHLFNTVYRSTAPAPTNEVVNALANFGDASKCIQ